MITAQQSSNRLNQDEVPSFDHPWQATAFAILVELNRAGHFEWDRWVKFFAKQINSSVALPGESYNDTYYRQLLEALESFLQELNLTRPDFVSERADEWRKAYLNTVHGHPVLLANALCPPKEHSHTHEAKREPVLVVPGSNKNTSQLKVGAQHAK